jgi:L,D-peptidoglycan transpeptidase YkuD (ErfK/YbiS/YcfS/YnhG family)
VSNHSKVFINYRRRQYIKRHKNQTLQLVYVGTVSLLIFYFPSFCDKTEFKMMKKLNTYGGSSRTRETTSSHTREEEKSEWEMRPGGMLVQKRTGKPDTPVASLRLRIAYGALRYDIYVSSMATFG